MGSLNIETIDDLKKALKENGYSSSAIEEIVKWYVVEQPAMN